MTDFKCCDCLKFYWKIDFGNEFTLRQDVSVCKSVPVYTKIQNNQIFAKNNDLYKTSMVSGEEGHV